MLEVQANGFGPAVFSYGGDTFNTAVYLRRCSQTPSMGTLSGRVLNPCSRPLDAESLKAQARPSRLSLAAGR